MDIKELLAKFHQAIEREEGQEKSELLSLGEAHDSGIPVKVDRAKERLTEVRKRLYSLKGAVAEIERMERTV